MISDKQPKEQKSEKKKIDINTVLPFQSLNKNETMAVIEKSTQPVSSLPEVSSFIQQPPPWLVWITVAFAFGTFIYRIITYIRKRRLSIGDDFWFRKILLPVCIEPLIKLVEDSVCKLKKLQAKTTNIKTVYDNYLKEFKSEKNSVISKFMVLVSKNSELYSNISCAIDEIEDIITMHCALASSSLIENKVYANADIVEQHIYLNLKIILNLLESEHKRRYKW